jgi:hypothetical protein
MLPYASALRDAGHEVRFATAPSFCAAVEKMGFVVSPTGHDFTWEHAVDFFPEMATAAAEGPAGERAQPAHRLGALDSTDDRRPAGADRRLAA